VSFSSGVDGGLHSITRSVRLTTNLKLHLHLCPPFLFFVPRKFELSYLTFLLAKKEDEKAIS